EASPIAERMMGQRRQLEEIGQGRLVQALAREHAIDRLDDRPEAPLPIAALHALDARLRARRRGERHGSEDNRDHPAHQRSLRAGSTSAGTGEEGAPPSPARPSAFQPQQYTSPRSEAQK